MGVVYLISQIAKWGNSQGLRLEKRVLQNLGLCIGDMVEITKKDDEIILRPIHSIDWYLQDYERPDDGWEDVEAKGREIW